VINPMRVKGGLMLSVAVAGISLFHAGYSWKQMHSGDRAAVVLASGLEQSARPETVLLGASVPASFVDSLRREDADRHFVLLDDSTLQQSPATGDLTTSMNQVQQVISGESAKFVVISDAAVQSKLESSLRALLRSDARFKLIGTFPVHSGDTAAQISSVYLYENVENAPAAVHYVPVRKVTGAAQLP
jgi:hypothetical protein